jgi:hypothetical protein
MNLWQVLAYVQSFHDMRASHKEQSPGKAAGTAKGISWDGTLKAGK